MAMAVRRIGSRKNVDICSRWRFATTEAAVAHSATVSETRKDIKFNVRPRSLSLPLDSKLRATDPPAVGFKGLLLKVLGFYGQRSRRIRAAKYLYSRIKSHVDKPDLYSKYGLENNFRTTHAMLVVHVWLILVRLRAEEKNGADIGQVMYEIFNHDLELRIVAAGVKVLISRWMKQLEQNFYGASMAYDAALQPTAKPDDLAQALWRNVFREDDSPMPTGTEAARVKAFANYVRNQLACLSMTESEALLTGNLSLAQTVGEEAAEEEGEDNNADEIAVESKAS